MANGGSATDSLRDPVFLTAVAALLFNDLLLKTQWPGPVSGKLSDFAGIVVFPVAMIAFLRRVARNPRPGVVLGVVCAWFIGLQVVPAVDLAHQAVLSSVMPWDVSNTMDPTDLVALMMVPLAHRVLVAPRPITLGLGARRAVTAVLILSCVADTGPPSGTLGPPNVNDAGQVEVGQGGDFEMPSGTRLDVGGSLGTVVVRETGDAPGLREACLRSNADHCFRLGEGVFAIEETVDGGRSWAESWGVREDRFLLREQGNSFLYYDEDERGIAVLPDDSVVVTTSIGPIVHWTAAQGWSPSPTSLRLQFWPYFLIATAFSASAALFALLRRRLLFSLFGSVVGLVAAMATVAIPLAVTFGQLLAWMLALGSGVVYLSVLAIGFAGISTRRSPQFGTQTMSNSLLALGAFVGCFAVMLGLVTEHRLNKQPPPPPVSSGVN